MRRVVYVGDNDDFAKRLMDFPDHEVVCVSNVVKFNNRFTDFSQIDFVLADFKLKGLGGLGIFEMYGKDFDQHRIPFAIVSSGGLDKSVKRQFLQKGISELYVYETAPSIIFSRAGFLREMLESRLSRAESIPLKEYKIPPGKRLFDLVIAFFAILLTSPLILLVCLAIKLESRGPVLYISKRVGTGYRVFDFYKFRSMYADADQRLAGLKHRNQYTENDPVVLGTKRKRISDSNISGGITLVYKDGSKLSESEFLEAKKKQQAGTFLKIKEDPRITKVGRFIRNTSIDELPQLLNVIKGDMSIVGNRPLPLYEAEKLTSDDWVERFLAPAGITGLWQVTKRGRWGMSEEERKALDNHYARNVNIWSDLWVVLRTIPALFQKENV